jgi:hypothetical protein
MSRNVSWTTFIVCMVITSVSNGVSGCYLTQREYQQQAIERGFAEYDGRTGEWKWKGE